MSSSVSESGLSLISESEGLPEHVCHQTGESWIELGKGIFSWSVFKFYSIRLLCTGDRFDPTRPYMLDLSYLRKLSSQQIKTISVQEMQRLAPSKAEQAVIWGQELESIVPDVGLGDRLVGWFKPGEGVHFFSQTHALGSILNADFVHAFAAIWLDPRTQRPALRLALLGEQGTAT